MSKLKLRNLTPTDILLLKKAAEKIVVEYKAKTHCEKALLACVTTFYARLVNKTLFMNREHYNLSIPHAEALAFTHFVIEGNFFANIGNEKYLIFELAGRIDKATV